MLSCMSSSIDSIQTTSLELPLEAAGNEMRTYEASEVENLWIKSEVFLVQQILDISTANDSRMAKKRKGIGAKDVTSTSTLLHPYPRFQVYTINQLEYPRSLKLGKDGPLGQLWGRYASVTHDAHG